MVGTAVKEIRREYDVLSRAELPVKYNATCAYYEECAFLSDQSWLIILQRWVELNSPIVPHISMYASTFESMRKTHRIFKFCNITDIYESYKPRYR